MQILGDKSEGETGWLGGRSWGRLRGGELCSGWTGVRSSELFHVRNHFVDGLLHLRDVFLNSAEHHVGIYFEIFCKLSITSSRSNISGLLFYSFPQQAVHVFPNPNHIYFGFEQVFQI